MNWFSNRTEQDKQPYQTGHQLGLDLKNTIDEKANSFGESINNQQFKYGVAFRNIILITIIGGGLFYFFFLFITAIKLL